jgi:hypothetical protein
MRMISTIIGGIFALLAVIFGLGIGMVAIFALAMPIMLLLLVPLLPVLLFVIILRRLGIVRSFFTSMLALVLGVVLLVKIADYGWGDRTSSISGWLEDNKELLETCASQDGAQITLDFDDGEPHFTCAVPKKKERADDAHI